LGKFLDRHVGPLGTFVPFVGPDSRIITWTQSIPSWSDFVLNLPSETPLQPFGKGGAAWRAHPRVEQPFEGGAKLQEPALGLPVTRSVTIVVRMLFRSAIRTRARVKSSYQSNDFLPALPFFDFRSVAATKQASEMAFIRSQKSLRNSSALVFNSGLRFKISLTRVAASI
jgi:hypothetical protein